MYSRRTELFIDAPTAFQIKPVRKLQFSEQVTLKYDVLNRAIYTI